MRVLLINGQNHKGSTYHIGRILAEKLTSIQEIDEIFLPRDLNHFCVGCCSCIQDERKCPYYEDKKKIEDAMEIAELIIFTTPTYCMELSAPLKAFIDLFYQYWIPHRPRLHMFHKKAVVITTAAGAGMKKAIQPMKRTLSYWGVPYIKGYGIAVQAAGFEQVSPKKKAKIEKDTDKLARKVMRASAKKPKLFIRFMFQLMASAKKKSETDDYFANESKHWRDNGWLDGKKPWKA